MQTDSEATNTAGPTETADRTITSAPAIGTATVDVDIQTNSEPGMVECREAAIHLRLLYARWQHPSYIFEMMPQFAASSLSTEYIPSLLALERDLNLVSMPQCAFSAAMSLQSLIQLSRDLAELWITDVQFPDPISGPSSNYLEWIDEYSRVADEKISLLN